MRQVFCPSALLIPVYRNRLSLERDMKLEDCDVFISYSRKDYIDENRVVKPDSVILKVRETLDRSKISYWFDEQGIYSGDEFAPIIARAIKNCKVFLFISSKYSNQSEWTSNEIAVAHAYKKKIIPFCVDKSIFNESIILYVAKLDRIEFCANQEKALDALADSVNEYLAHQREKSSRERIRKVTQVHLVPGLVGMSFFNPIQSSILERRTLDIQYKPYQSASPKEITFFPYVLKEFRNRWFVLGSLASDMKVLTLALDRIVSCSINAECPFQDNPAIDVEHFFDDVIGVGKKLDSRPINVFFWVSEVRYKYLVTKPIHASQEVFKKIPGNGCIFKIRVCYNRELISEFMTYGSDLRVISPYKVVRKMKTEYLKGAELYNSKSSITKYLYIDP